MTTITSPHNPHLKELRKLRRRRERERSGRFLAEGEDLIAAAIAAGRPAIAGYRAAGTAIGGAGFEDVEQSVMASLSTLGSGTRAIGVYEQRFTKPVGPLCVYLHGVGDPGNVGAVLRSALAFEASCVALGPGCADPHSPKAVRASMGAIFAIELARVSDVGELPGTRVALVAGEGEPIWSVRGSAGDGGVQRMRGGAERERDQSVRGTLANAMPPARAGGMSSGEQQSASLTLLVGAEREGLPDDVVETCERVANIPISSESLNAAMAATVALYEMTRGGRDNDDRVPSP
ncbi:MAG TPA: RNA methyltransferase [Solirubrobacteraceae bacterium]|jgi:TrmH family RNA methyltransferase|nr:RNA methyltransferase [Solirubrobacteraceae bacterium]